MNAKTEAYINVIVAVLVVAAAFFSVIFSIVLAVSFLMIIAAYKYFYAPKSVV